ncbi:BTAD domain-containing putative transcriptional regulator [Streptosporangium soli]|nr:tetratricopeptide repeat protein [Streptosporangium sp. KLBMP 9127]
MEFRILGPLEAVVDGRPVGLGGVRPRLLLATLLLSPGRRVPLDGLIESVWGAEPPGSARTQLSIHVSALRRALGNADVIETVDSGYRIRAENARIDVLTAERRLARAEEEVAAGRTEEAVAVLEEALALWRGPVLAGLDSAVIADGARRLEELRLAAAEEWAELKLALGQHRELVGDLTSLLAEQPFRERLRAALMLALSRSGRQADALEVYREGRVLLVDELGQEPGPELRELEQAILREDPSLGLPSPEPRHGDMAAMVPAELPGDVGTFTGRDEEIERLCELLAGKGSHGGRVAIAGPGGIGKSALAIHVAHRMAADFPDGQLYVNLAGATPDATPAKPGDVLARFLRSLGLSAAVPADDDEAAARFRSLTNGKRLLVVLDDAVDAAQVRPLLPGSATCAVLITSRPVLGHLDGIIHQRLDVLPEDDAIELLSRIAGGRREGVAEVAALCGGLPLALGIAGARLNARPDWTMRTMADRLAVQQRRLAELEVDDQAVRATFMVSYQSLDSPEVARMFRLLGLLNGPDTGLFAAAALAGLPEGTAAGLLDRLVESQLVEEHVPGRYRLHDLLCLFARERAGAEESARSRKQAVERVLWRYLHLARTAVLAATPGDWRVRLGPEVPAGAAGPVPHTGQGDTWIQTETENLIHAARQAVDSDHPGIAVGLTGALNTSLEQRARWQEQRALGELTLRAADRTGDPVHHGLGHNDIAWVYFAISRLPEALVHFDKALEMWRSAGTGAGVALALQGRGAALRALGRLEESLESLAEARAVCAAQGDRRREAACMTSTGLTYGRLGRYAEAVAAHRAAVELARRTTTSWLTEIMSLGNLGNAHRVAGDPEQAVVVFEEVLREGRARHYAGTYWEAEHLWGLGRALHDLGRDGRASWRHSAAILRELGLITAEECRVIEDSREPTTPEVISHQL